jgi:hypothetical protein
MNNKIILILIVISFACCEKEDKDFRDKYIGEWKFNVEITEFNTDSIGYYYHDSLTYAGTITYGDSDNDIEIKYTNDNSITLSLNENGELSNFPTQYCNGNFEGDNKIYLYLRWGGLGGGITHEIDGVKR